LPADCLPIVDTLSRYVDQRVRVANVTAESTLTRDTVPVNVDAIVFWLVWNPEKSIKDRGAMVVVPSSAVETMGMGGMLATASLGGAKAQ
jgi:regulator of protease activity HflC (stomatin/prohibitin superfamily)